MGWEEMRWDEIPYDGMRWNRMIEMSWDNMGCGMGLTKQPIEWTSSQLRPFSAINKVQNRLSNV